MNRITLLSAVLTLIASSAHAAPTPKYKVRWLLGHANLDYFEEAAQKFKTAVESESKGEIAVEIVSGIDQRKTEATGHEAEIAAKVGAGEAEMGHSFTDVVGGVDSKFYAFEAPYLFRDYRHMEGVLEGPVGREMLEGLRSQKIVGLSFTYSGGASGVASMTKDLRKPEDLKGLKIGVYGDPMNEAWLKGLGAEPVAIGHGIETIVARAQKGDLDAVVTTWRNFERPSLNQAFKSVGLMGSTYLVSVTYVNEKFYESLPAKYQKLLMDASRTAGRIERAKTIELNESAKRQMLARGVREIHAPKAAREKFAAALGPAYQKTLESLVGKDLLERIQKAPDADPAAMPEGLATHWPVGP